RLGWGPENEMATVLVNIVWTLYNLLILGAAVAVAVEAKQIRRDHRVEVSMPVAIRLRSGHLLQAEMKDFSLSGLRVRLGEQDSERLNVQVNQKLEVVLSRGQQSYVFPATIAFTGNGVLGLQLSELSTQQQI